MLGGYEPGGEIAERAPAHLKGDNARLVGLMFSKIRCS